MTNQIEILKQMFESLSDNQKADFLDYLQPKTSKISIHDLILKSNTIKCPHCSSKEISKNGHKGKTQRYICKHCKKSFVGTTNTILQSTKKSIDTWFKYLECLMNKFSLRKTSKICNINLHTAFNWRHKVLDSLQFMQSNVKLDGVVEADETFFPISFKGKHKNFKLPRVSHHRGHQISIRGLSKEQVCIPCVCNLNGLSVGKISNLGKPNFKDLEHVLNNRIENGSVFVTDSFKSYQKIAFENQLTHIRIPRNKYTNGSFNIQTINYYHSELKRLVIYNFKGVATKYLNNYVVYHNFVNFAKKSFESKLTELKEFICNTICLTKGYSIINREPILTFD